ncbi:MAG: BrnT family toxin [candidate division NC10 bacterium]|nr:BrnT family toxin [candidate division NC10 bacterium]
MPEPLRFEWEPQKAAVNRAKHKISFEEAVSVLGDPLGRITDDPRHSETEERYVLLGPSARRRLLAVMFTERGQAIRLISARNATRHEGRAYGKNKG